MEFWEKPLKSGSFLKSRHFNPTIQNTREPRAGRLSCRSFCFHVKIYVFISCTVVCLIACFHCMRERERALTCLQCACMCVTPKADKKDNSHRSRVLDEVSNSFSSLPSKKHTTLPFFAISLLITISLSNLELSVSPLIIIVGEKVSQTAVTS